MLNRHCGCHGSILKIEHYVLVGTENSDTCFVPTYDWSTFLTSFFNKLAAVKCYHRFKFKEDGVVVCKKSVKSEEISMVILKKK